MEKVYLLLRQNTESGPFTLSELQHLHLQPTDLIWIEGVSNSWSAPTILTDQPQNEFRGPDTNDWVSPRSEEGRRAPEQGGSQASLAVGSTSLQGSGPSGTYREPEDIELIFHKKGGATVSLVQLLGVAAITALLALAWDNRFALLQTKEDAVSYASTPVVFVPKLPEPSPIQTAAALVIKDSSSELPEQPINKVGNAVKSKKELPNHRKGQRPKTVVNQSAEKEAERLEVKEAPPVVDIAPAKTVIVDTPPASTPEGANEGEHVRKKTLGQTIKGLFKKKNKGDRKKDEERSNEEE
jgi:hypothetical protein